MAGVCLNYLNLWFLIKIGHVFMISNLLCSPVCPPSCLPVCLPVYLSLTNIELIKSECLKHSFVSPLFYFTKIIIIDEKKKTNFEWCFDVDGHDRQTVFRTHSTNKKSIFNKLIKFKISSRKFIKLFLAKKKNS